MKLYKVLVNGKSCHGWDYEWPLPNGKKPGEWTPPVKNARVCHSGYHLTTDPTQWLKVGCQCFEAEGKGEAGSEKDKRCFRSARLLRKAKNMIPSWWTRVESLVGECKAMPYFKQTARPRKSWKIFSTRAAAWAAAWAAARDAAGDAAGDAALLARIRVCDGLPLDQKHIDHAEARWDVWRRGYGLACDVDGVLYVYKKP